MYRHNTGGQGRKQRCKNGISCSYGLKCHFFHFGNEIEEFKRRQKNKRRMHNNTNIGNNTQFKPKNHSASRATTNNNNTNNDFKINNTNPWNLTDNNNTNLWPWNNNKNINDDSTTSNPLDFTQFKPQNHSTSPATTNNNLFANLKWNVSDATNNTNPWNFSNNNNTTTNNNNFFANTNNNTNNDFKWNFHDSKNNNTTANNSTSVNPFNGIVTNPFNVNDNNGKNDNNFSSWFNNNTNTNNNTNNNNNNNNNNTENNSTNNNTKTWNSPSNTTNNNNIFPWKQNNNSDANNFAKDNSSIGNVSFTNDKNNNTNNNYTNKNDSNTFIGSNNNSNNNFTFNTSNNSTNNIFPWTNSDANNLTNNNSSITASINNKNNNINTCNNNNNNNCGVPNNRNILKYNQNPYQIDMRDGLKEINDPTSKINNSFTSQPETDWRLYISNTKTNINSLTNSYIKSNKKRMNLSIIKLTPRNKSYLQNTPSITIQPRSSKTTNPLNAINPSLHSNKYQSSQPIRTYQSQIRRITNLGPVPKAPDLTQYYVTKPVQSQEILSENSEDSPAEIVEEFQENNAKISDIILTSTHRTDGILYPKLMRDKYYTIPSMNVLKTMNEKQLCMVKDFTVGHSIHGSVTWNGLSDIRSLDLDTIVYLEHGCVEVYPEYINDKPEQGKGLNKYAMIRLNNIYAMNGNGGLNDEEYELIKKCYGEKLAKHCDENDCEFIQYDTKQAIWKFSVKHF